MFLNNLRYVLFILMVINNITVKVHFDQRFSKSDFLKVIGGWIDFISKVPYVENPTVHFFDLHLLLVKSFIPLKSQLLHSFNLFRYSFHNLTHEHYETFFLLPTILPTLVNLLFHNSFQTAKHRGT